MTASAFIHRFEPATGAGSPPLLLLHGTGGDENDLLGLGRTISPGSALLSPRGRVLEHGMPRFFRRLAEGVFDEDDVRRRAHELGDFVTEARQRYGIAAPASADLARAVVMSFSAAAVWRIRRAAPMLPTVLLGETSRFLGGGAATTVGATAVGPSIATLREHPELVDKAAAQGRALYCWTVDHYEDVRYCRDVGVAWVATNHPGRTKDWLENGLTGAGRD